jgi:hypothetical protein
MKDARIRIGANASSVLIAATLRALFAAGRLAANYCYLKQMMPKLHRSYNPVIV